MIAKYKYYLIGGVLLFSIALGYVVCDRASVEDKLNYWKGQYQELKNITEADEKIKLAAIADLEEKNSLLQGAIDSANTIIVNLEESQANADISISDLNTALVKAKTDAERVPILTALVDEWKDKFSLAQKEIAEKDRVIFSLTEQYQAEMQISANYKVLWEKEHTLRLKCEKGIGLFDKRIATLQRQVKLTRVVALGAVALTLFLKK